jgi:hypothetical protein
MIKLLNLIPKKIRNFIFELRLTPDSPSNLHGDERTQRQFVIDLASQHPFGLISLSDIAEALETTRDDVRDNYARLIRYYANKSDFEKIVPEVPFHSAAIYQLVSRAQSAPISPDQLNKIKHEEELKYKGTTGVFYAVSTDSSTQHITLGYLNLRDDEDVNKYKQMMPAEQDVYGEKFTFDIGNSKITKLPEKFHDKIIPASEFEEFVRSEME